MSQVLAQSQLILLILSIKLDVALIVGRMIPLVTRREYSLTPREIEIALL